MKNLFTPCRYGRKKGFTLIELLIVIAVLGILAAVVIPNVTSFIRSGKVAAANSELATAKTANQGYAAANDGTWATTSANLGSYLNGPLVGLYSFNGSTGSITSASYPDVNWDGSIKFK